MTEEEKEYENPLDKVEQDNADIIDAYNTGMTNALDEIDKGYENVDAQLSKGQQQLTNAYNAQLDYTIDEVERQKAQTQKDYEKEQKAAFVDYQKQIDPYGANAEKMVSAGLDNSGFAESSKVAMYNQYQQRVAVARESMQRSFDEYNATIAQARASNSVAMAQLGYETLLKKMQYNTEHMLKRADLITSMTEGQTKLKQDAKSDWMQMYELMNQNEDLPIKKDVDGTSEEKGVNEASEEKEPFNFFDFITSFFTANPKQNQEQGEKSPLLTEEQWQQSEYKDKYNTYEEYVNEYREYFEEE